MNLSVCFRLFIFSFFVFAGFSVQSQKGTLTEVSFVQGHWLGTFNGGPIEAFWAAPAGDNIAGYMRMMRDNKVTMYEMLVFEQTDQGPVVLVKHFKPGLIGVEEKEVSDRYRFIEAKKGQALFEKSDGSVRILYEHRTENQLVFQRGKQEEGKWVFADLFVFDRIK